MLVDVFVDAVCILLSCVLGPEGPSNTSFGTARWHPPSKHIIDIKTKYFIELPIIKICPRC